MRGRYFVNHRDEIIIILATIFISQCKNDLYNELHIMHITIIIYQ